MRKLYSLNGNTPDNLPNIIKLSDGTYIYGRDSFTEEQIKDAGYVRAEEPPHVNDYDENLEWDSNELKWVITKIDKAELQKKFESFKKYKYNQITSIRNSVLCNLTVEWNDDIWDADEETSNRITSIMNVIRENRSLGNEVPSTIKWRTYYNKDVILTIEELTKLNFTIFLAQQQIWAKQSNLKNLIQAANTEEEIKAIEW